VASFRKLTFKTTQYTINLPNEPPITKDRPGILTKLKISELENCSINDISNVTYLKVLYHLDKQEIMNSFIPKSIEVLGE
jgi:hypothetical protein